MNGKHGLIAIGAVLALFLFGHPIMGILAFLLLGLLFAGSAASNAKGAAGSFGAGFRRGFRRRRGGQP